jgi:hypothetical protein
LTIGTFWEAAKMIVRSVLCGVLLMCATNLQSVGGQRPWPQIAPFESTYTFHDVALGEDTPVFAILKDIQGVPRYRLECHNGAYNGESIISFSGTFQCAVVAVDADKVVSWNLLAEATRDQHTSDWSNRGRFLATHLRKPCSTYREYGPERTFRFRGMKLMLRLRDFDWSDDSHGSRSGPGGFTLDVAAEHDPDSTTASSAHVRVPVPPRECF